MIWINAVACILSIVGAVGAWRLIARGRVLPRGAGETSRVVWAQPVLVRSGSAARQLAAIVPHSLAQVIISVLLVGSINRGGRSPMSFGFRGPSAQWMAQALGVYDGQVNLISWIAAVFAGAVAGATLGALVGFGLVIMFGPKVSVSVDSDGVRLGSLLLPWDNVVTVRLYPVERTLLLFAADPPGAYPLALTPPTDELYEQLGRTVEELLAARLAVAEPMWPSARRLPSPVALGLVTLIAVLLSLMLYRVSAEWVWFVYGLALVVVSWVGGRYFQARSASMVRASRGEAGA